MREDRFQRNRMLLGEAESEKLRNSRVAIFGVGGVGGYVAEALARSGVGFLHLIDADTVSESNCNRQIVALTETIGRQKTDVMRERISGINPEAETAVSNIFYLPETAGEFDLSAYDYVVDAVDTVTAKLELIERCQAVRTPMISSMGTGNKLDPSRLRVADLYETSVCPLARIMRRECRKRGIEALRVVFSTEEPVRVQQSVPGSMVFVPGVAGLLIASEVVRDLTGRKIPRKENSCG